MSERTEKIKQWLEEFSDCVNAEDFERGKTLYSQDAVYFGSYMTKMSNLDDLVEKQWKQIWPNISNFTFNFDECHTDISEDENMTCVKILWNSTGYHPDGTTFERPGRLTMLLKWDPEKNHWLAHHTHYSLKPQTPAVTKKN